MTAPDEVFIATRHPRNYRNYVGYRFAVERHGDTYIVVRAWTDTGFCFQFVMEDDFGPRHPAVPKDVESNRNFKGHTWRTLAAQTIWEHLEARKDIS